GKQHAHVLRDIKELECSEEFRLSNFGESSYINSQNKKQPMYYMTRDGFTILVMGYTGEKAMRFKEAYIKQFNVMEKALQGKLIEREKGIAMLCKSIKKISSQENSQPFSFKRFPGSILKIV
ncbi:MAG: Rha family transcriptional regulator, partial [Dorea sp.]|nr:Rha family transcriptional regulator [Dorea sp.]